MSYSNYSTYLKYKNCCRPIGDTGPPGPVGPTGPIGGINIPGNKGEILYFSETDNLVSTDNVFIQEGNVTIDNNVVITRNLSMSDQFINDVSGIYFSDETYIGHGSSFDITTSETLDISAAGGISVTGNLSINDATTVNKTLDVIGNTTLENLFVNGSINNLIEISSDTIQPIISESVNLGKADKKFDFGYFYQINSTIARADTLAMKNGSIINVDNISSSSQSILDINSSYIVAINGSYGVTITGNLTIDDSATFCDILDVSGATTIRSNLSMNDNFINDVSGIYFSDTTYIGHGSSFDITTSETLDISAAGGVTLTGNLSMNKNSIKDVDTIYFSENTYITSNIADDKLSLYGNSIFMEAGVNGDFTFTGNSNNVDLNFLTLNATGFTINYNDNDDKIRFNNDDFVIDNSNNYIGIQTDSPSATLEVNGNAIINGNLSMNDNFIDQINFIQFSDNHNGQIFSPLERNSFLLYNPITTNSSFQECIFNYNDSSNNGLISPQIFDTTGNVITFGNAILNTFNYATFSVCCSGFLSSGSKNDIIFDLNDSTGKLQKNFTIDTRSITGNGSVAFGPVSFKITDISNTTFNNSIFKNNQYKLRVKSGGSSNYALTKIRLSVNII